MLYLIAIGVAMAVDDIEDVFNIVGAVAANAISFIFPSLFYITLVKRKKRPVTYRYYLSLAVFVFFIPFGIFAMISNIIKEK